MNYFKRGVGQSGFTLTEVVIALALFVLISVVLYSIYTLHQKAYTTGEARAEILQNGRVILERMTREIRQAKNIVTELSDDETGATSTILFQDGHDISTIQYIHYFKEGFNIKREKIAYYFSGDSTTYVVWNANPPQGQEKIATTTEASQIIGEYVASLKIWGLPLINISINLEKGGQIVDLKTKILGRNL